VDYDSGTEALNEPASWNPDLGKFLDTKGKILDRKNLDSPQFHQMNVWATLQNALDFFENGFGLGRRIAWGFEGNRLIVVPHAGYGQNAFYDRDSKSLQFYYFDSDKSGKLKRIHTCLSADIINHEFGHAVLDGIRPHYQESVFAETAAFHEFLGDLSAILIAFRNNAFRAQIAEATRGDLNAENPLASLAEEFGGNIGDQPYLRSALNDLKYDQVKNDQRQHYMSQVLTGAMFDIIRRLMAHYMTKREECFDRLRTCRELPPKLQIYVAQLSEKYLIGIGEERAVTACKRSERDVYRKSWPRQNNRKSKKLS